MADIKISALPAAASVTTADIAVINQGGVTKTANLSLIRGISGTVTSVTGGTGLTGGTITTSGTLAVNFGTTAGTVAQGNDSRIVNAVTTTQLAAYATTTQLANYTPTTRSVASGTGLTGGGNLSADRTLSVSFGTLAGTVAEGNDSRLSNARTPTAHASSHAAGGSDPITPASIGAASTAQLAAYATTAQLAGYTPTTRTVSAGTGLTGGGDLSADRTLSLSDVGTAGTYGSASAVPVVTTNSKGQVSSVSTQQIAILGSQVSGNISGNAANVTGTVAVTNGGTGATSASVARSNLSAAQSGANTDITSVALTTGTISSTPSATTDIVNKAYADSIGSSINFHDACDYATIAPLSPSATYNQPGGAGVGATLIGTTNALLQVDGVTVSQGQRILVKNQSNQIQNGVYVVTAQADGLITPYILTRATDYDTSGSAPNEVQAGDFILVLNGSIANTAWVQQTPAPIVFGSSNIVFIQFAAASAAYLAGTGLSLSNNTFSITTTGVANLTAGGPSAVPVITTNTQGQITNLTTAQITPSAIGAVATANLTQLATAGKVPQLDGSGLISTSQIPALTPAQIAQITPVGIGAVPTSDLTLLASANKVPKLDGSGYLSTAQLADIAGLPVGAVGSSTVVPVITTDTKGRITNLTTAQIAGGGGSAGVASFSAGTTGFTPNTATTGVVTLAGTLNIANGGTGATTQQAALNALAGSVTSGQYLRGNGTNVSMSSLQSSDLSGTIAIANGGTGATTQQGALNAIAGSQTAGYYFRSDGTNVSLQPMSANDISTGTVAVARGGTGASTAETARLAMGGMVQMDWFQVNAVVGTYDTVAGTLTYSSTGALSIDSGTPVAGDLVFLSGQGSASTPNQIANGPWVVTNAGGTGVAAVLTRPSWFTGTFLSAPYFVARYGSTQTGVVRTVVGPATTSKTGFTVGTSLLTPVAVTQRNSNFATSGGTLTGRMTFVANSNTVNPFNFQASTGLLTTSVAHAVEWDGSQMYVTNSSLERLSVATSKIPIITEANTSHTLASTEGGYLIVMNPSVAGSASSVLVPTDASVNFPIGTQFLISQLGTGQVTVSAVTPATTGIGGKNGLKTSGQYAIISLIKIAANSWIVGGDASVI